jgi:hypothetical protein
MHTFFNLLRAGFEKKIRKENVKTYVKLDRYEPK